MNTFIFLEGKQILPLYLFLLTKLVLIFIKVAFTDGHPNQNCVMQKVLGIYSWLQQLNSDGQCDSPGHSATYNTVSAIDAETNKVINFRVVNVKA